jgi:NADH-quinone oxidoreductase subunit M
MFVLTSPVITIITLLGTALFAALLLPSKNIALIRQLCLSTSFVALCVAVLMSLSFDKAAVGYQFVSSFSFVAEYNSTFAVGVDGLSYIFLVLTLFTFPFLFLAS